MEYSEKVLLERACIALLIVGAIVGLGFLINAVVVNTATTYVTVRLVEARGLDADDEPTRPVELDVSIGLLHLQSFLAAAHDGGVTISYAGTKLAEGPVPKFYVAGGHRWSQATRAVASACKDQAPPSQGVFRDHLWVDQQINGEAEFDIALSLFNVNITTGEKTYDRHNCKAGLALDGKAKASKCGAASYFTKP